MNIGISQTIQDIVMTYFIIINVIAFLMYGIDKAKAAAGSWRISEATLICIAVLGGFIGAWIGMKVWHHKTQKLKFQVFIPLITIAWIAVALYFMGIIHF